MRVEVAGRLFNQLHAGDCFGEQSLLSGAPRNAIVPCETVSCCLVLAMDGFCYLMRRSTEIQHDIENIGT